MKKLIAKLLRHFAEWLNPLDDVVIFEEAPPLGSNITITVDGVNQEQDTDYSVIKQ